MTNYPDLDDFFEPNLVLPIGGVEYVIEPPSALDVIRLRRIFADPAADATSVDRLDWQAKLLGAEWDAEAQEYVGADGSVWAEMLANGVGGEAILRAGNTALLRFGINPELASVYWGPDDPLADALDELAAAADTLKARAGDGAGKGPGSNRKNRRAAPKKKAS